jgi:arylformamidase
MRIIDISVPISNDMHVYPGDPGIDIQPASKIADGASSNSSRLNFGSHTGTHIDAPRHFIEGRLSVDELPLHVLVGKAYVAEVTATERVTPRDLEGAGIPKGTQRILLKTINSKLIWRSKSFRQDFVHLAEESAKWLLDRDVQLVGIDYLSIEQFHSPTHRVHLDLLNANVVILEGLNLNGVAPGEYTLCCLPLKIKGGDGAPARAVLLEE